MSHRIQKINELIRQELGKIIFEEEEFGPGVLVTIMEVETSPDIREAAITVSVLPTEKGKDALKKLTSHAGQLQKLLNKKLKMHPVPKIRFLLDQTESESQQIDKLFKKIGD